MPTETTPQRRESSQVRGIGRIPVIRNDQLVATCEGLAERNSLAVKPIVDQNGETHMMIGFIMDAEQRPHWYTVELTIHGGELQVYLGEHGGNASINVRRGGRDNAGPWPSIINAMTLVPRPGSLSGYLSGGRVTTLIASMEGIGQSYVTWQTYLHRSASPSDLPAYLRVESLDHRFMSAARQGQIIDIRPLTDGKPGSLWWTLVSHNPDIGAIMAPRAIGPLQAGTYFAGRIPSPRPSDNDLSKLPTLIDISQVI